MAPLRLVPALFAAASFLSVAVRAEDAPPPPPAEVVLEVRGGRASLVQGDEVRTLTRASRKRTVRGEAYVELGPGSELSLRWSGFSSLSVRGPAALEWTPSAADPARPVLRILRFGSLEAEVRRGEQELRLPRGWTLRLGRGAVYATESARGIRVDHRGGAAAVATQQARPGERGTIRSGQRVLLPAGS